MGYIPKHEELAALSDEALVSRYNAAATNTVVGTAFYLDELSRRQSARENARMLKATQTMRTLTWAIFVLTIANVALVAVPLLRSWLRG